MASMSPTPPGSHSSHQELGTHTSSDMWALCQNSPTFSPILLLQTLYTEPSFCTRPGQRGSIRPGAVVILTLQVMQPELDGSCIFLWGLMEYIPWWFNSIICLPLMWFHRVYTLVTPVRMAFYRQPVLCVSCIFSWTGDTAFQIDSNM